MSPYSNPEEVERAIRKAIQKSGREPGDTYRQFLRDRLLSRIFAGGAGRYVLKGGSGMLARIPDARATRDIDLALRDGQRESVDNVLRGFTALIKQDLGDLFVFMLRRAG